MTGNLQSCTRRATWLRVDVVRDGAEHRRTHLTSFSNLPIGAVQPAEVVGPTPAGSRLAALWHFLGLEHAGEFQSCVQIRVEFITARITPGGLERAPTRHVRDRIDLSIRSRRRKIWSALGKFWISVAEFGKRAWTPGSAVMILSAIRRQRRSHRPASQLKGLGADGVIRPFIGTAGKSS